MKGKEQLATWVDAPIRRRLRVYAAVSSTTITDVVTAALDRYLPAMTDMVHADSAADQVSAVGFAADAPACEQRRELSVVQP